MGHYTKLEMRKLGVCSVSAIVNRIVEVEETLLNSISFDSEHQDRSYSSPSRYNQRKRDSYTSRNTYRQKWCPLHKSKGHDKSECYVLKNKNQESNKKYHTTNLIIEPTQETKPVSLSAIIKEANVNCLLDTGAQGNYINTSIAESLKLPIERLAPLEIELANKTKEIVIKSTSFGLSFPETRETVYKIKARLLDNASYDLILGMSFLKDYKVCLDFESNKIKVGSQEYEIPENPNTDWKNCPDQKIFERVNSTIISSTNEMETLERIVEEAKKANPTIGKIGIFPHHIELKEKLGFRFSPYQIPIKLQRAVTEELKRLKDNSIIRPSFSSVVSPAFPVLKRDGSVRLVVDFRRLNSATETSNYPLPDLRYILTSLKGKRYFSILDLNMGYYQVPMSKESIPLTAFVIGREQFEFCRMPFGLCNAPKTFQRTVNKIFNEVPNVITYLDDILVSSSSYREHCSDLKATLQALITHGASINFKKSLFRLKEVTYLGQVISEAGIKPDLARINNLSLNPPRGKRQIMKLVGLLNWFRPFLPNASLKLLRFTNKLQGKKETISWSKEDTESLVQVINEIKTQTPLRHPNYEDPFVLKTDASEYAVGAVLLQSQGPIGFFSRKLTLVQLRHSIVEKELFAVLVALEFFKTLLFDGKIILQSDNKNICFDNIVSQKRFSRWKYLLSEYNLKLQHIPGESNSIADTLSRIS